ncbi:hypothetical protein KC878_04255 [Candidatus Saccharibacteria bacterium]|nr:hypothetical protein [Candidatus Saccharibacteria bacterium]MCB9821468.1 hypothetical protein [Candidatus Nomurabacteria bacterium]
MSHIRSGLSRSLSESQARLSADDPRQAYGYSHGYPKMPVEAMDINAETLSQSFENLNRLSGDELYTAARQLAQELASKFALVDGGEYEVDAKQLLESLRGCIDFPDMHDRHANGLLNNLDRFMGAIWRTTHAYEQRITHERGGFSYIDYALWEIELAQLPDYVAASLEADDLDYYVEGVLKALGQGEYLDDSIIEQAEACLLRVSQLRQSSPRELRRSFINVKFVEEAEFDRTIADYKRKSRTLSEWSELRQSRSEQYETAARFAGRKYANLLILRDGLDYFHQHLPELDVAECFVPIFTGFGAEHYDTWLQTGVVPAELVEAIENWIANNPSGDGYILRSSGINTEDGEHMAPGIFESTILGSTNRDAIIAAIELVYSSAISDRASAFLTETNQAQERMGLVLQHLVMPPDYTKRMTIDTVKLHNPALAQARIDEIDSSDAQNIRVTKTTLIDLNRKGMVSEFGSSQYSHDPAALRFHIPPDIRKIPVLASHQAAQVAVLCEKIMGCPVQIETVEDYLEDRDVIAIVQARALPTNWLEQRGFDGFPEADQKPSFIGRASGFANGLNVRVFDNLYLFEAVQQIEKTGEAAMVSFRDSFGQHGADEYLLGNIGRLDSSQRELLVVHIERPPHKVENDLFASGYGHLETLFGVLGIKLVITDPEGNNYGQIDKQSRYKVFMDGSRAQLYRL